MSFLCAECVIYIIQILLVTSCFVNFLFLLSVSEWRTMVPDKKACSGTVLVHWRQGLSAVSRENFNETEKKKLCQNMDCGGYQSTNEIHPQTIEIDSFWNKSFSCGENPGSIWECENKSTPSRKEPVFIECKSKIYISRTDLK